MKVLGKLYELKEDSIGVPQRYLGANVGKYQLEDESFYWLTSAYDYCKAAVRNTRELLDKEGIKLAAERKADCPYPEKYKLEVDVTNELEPHLATRYMQLIGILHQSVELGRIDILHE
eukprot:11958691-Ditylum_brightwellii.AAC.1